MNESIKETWDTLTYGLTACQAAYTKEQKTAARNLALASFDKARYQTDCGNEMEDCEPDDPCGYHANRIQIEALGA